MTSERALGLLYVALQFLCMGWLIAGTALRPVHLGAVLLVGLGTGLGLWAVVTMRPVGFNITPTPRAQTLVTAGPYRRIRHPMYTAVLLVMLGLVVQSFGWVRLAVWVALAVTLVMKLHHEERLLARRFPAYDAYRATTARLIPGLY